MPLDLSQAGTTPNIENEIDSASLSAIDLVEVDLGLGYKKRWSNRQVDFGWVAGHLDGEYEARILSISERRWSLGPDDDSVTLLIGNADGAISRMSREFGIDIFEGAKVRLHRLFPSIKEVYRDYWVGTGEPVVISEGAVEWVITFGISSLKRKFGRQAEFNCPHVFAGGPASDCPYNLENGIGEPEKKLVSIATAGTNNELIVAARSTFQTSLVVVGWYVFSREGNTYAKITSVNSQTELSISFPVNGEGGRSFRSGDRLIIGPPLLECPGKNPASCKERGMFGKHGGNRTGSGDKRRYYGGDAESARVRFSGRIPSTRGRFGGGGTRFSRTALGNDSVSGHVVPVIFGFYRIRDVPSTYHAPAGTHQHGLFVLCEGEIVDFNILDVNGFRPDNNPPDELDSLNEQIRNDSYIKWGTWAPGGVEDSRATNINIAKQIRQAIGRRKSVAIKSGNKIIDTYGNGGVYGHPYLFNTGSGDGTSQHGLVVARIRIETQQDIQTALTGSFDIFGLLVPLPPGMENNEEDRSAYNLAIGNTTLKYTATPNPIQVAYTLLTNDRWGAGLPSSSIDIGAVIRESNYCEERIEGMDSAGRIIHGSVDISSSGARGTPLKPWVFLGNVLEPSNSMVGRVVTFNKSSANTFQAVIIANEFYEVFQDDDLDYLDSGYYQPDPADIDPEGNWVQLDRPFPVGKEPIHGTEVEVVGGYFTKRFKANGPLADRVPLPDMLQTVLDNCNGTYRTNGDKLEFIIRKELSPAEINDVIGAGIFTDRGTKRNIIRSSDGSGESTMQVWRDLDTDIGNFFSVTFMDRARSFQESIVTVTNDAAQKRASKLFGEEGREKIEDQIELALTTSRDQAARLLALRARELSIQNLYCSFETSLKRGMKTQPGDIIAVDSETISSFFNVSSISRDVAIANSFLFRVLEKVETGTFTIKLTCKIHVNPIYSDYATDFVQFFGPKVTQREKGVMPAQVTPLPATESVILQHDGTPRSIVTVRVTYPNLGDG